MTLQKKESALRKSLTIGATVGLLVAPLLFPALGGMAVAEETGAAADPLLEQRLSRIFFNQSSRRSLSLSEEAQTRPPSPPLSRLEEATLHLRGGAASPRHPSSSLSRLTIPEEDTGPGKNDVIDQGVEMTHLRSRRPFVRHDLPSRRNRILGYLDARFQQDPLLEIQSLTKLSYDAMRPHLEPPKTLDELLRYGVTSEYDLFKTPIESVTRYRDVHNRDRVGFIPFERSVEYEGNIREVLRREPRLEKYYELSRRIQERNLRPKRRHLIPLPDALDGLHYFQFSESTFFIGQSPRTVTLMHGYYPLYFDYMDLRSEVMRDESLLSQYSQYSESLEQTLPELERLDPR